MVSICWALQAKDTLFQLSIASAYVGIALLIASLLIGPWNVLRGRPNPVSTDVRRDLGIWAGLLSLTHAVVGLQVHMGGQWWLYFFSSPASARLFSLRSDAFGLANFTGLGAVLVLILLLGLSNNCSLRTLGVRRWKALQRWNYAGFVLVAAHGVVYQLLEKRNALFIGLLGGMVLGVVAMQLAGFRRRLSMHP